MKLPSVKEMVIKLLLKWLTVPLTFLVVALTGAAINLPEQFIKTKEKHDLVVNFGLEAVYLGLYSGVIAGIMVDKISNLVSFLVAAVLALIAYIPLAFVTDLDGTPINLAILFLFFIAGLSGSIGVITSVVSLAKNFDAGKASLLLVTIAITYWKLASGMDNSLHTGFMKEASNEVYFIVVGVIIFVTLLIAAFAMTKVELGTTLDTLSKEADSTGIFIFVIVTSILLVTFFVFADVLDMGIVASSVFLFFLFVNFLILGLAIFLIYKMIKSGKGMSAAGALGAVGAKKPDEFTTGQMCGKKKYIHMCVVAFCILGSSLTFEDLIIEQGIAGGEAAAGLAGALKANWFADVMSRFIGGVIAYFILEKVSIWVSIVVFTIIAFIGHVAGLVVFATDAGKTGAIFAPAILVGLGSGAIWSLIPMELIHTAQYKAFGQNWGTVLLFGMIGFLLFALTIFFAGENGIIAACIFVVFSIVAIVSAILGWMDDKANAKPPVGRQSTTKPASTGGK